MDTPDYIGKGWVFPPVFDRQTGQARLVGGMDNITQSLAIIINTNLGERVLRDEFGSVANELVFEPFSANMKTYMDDRLRFAIEANEPRVANVAVSISQPDPNVGKLDIEIVFEVAETGQPGNLVLPYYLPEDRT